MEIILRSNNSLFQCAVNQIQSYNCFWIQVVISAHSTFKLIFGGQKRFQIHNKIFQILTKIVFCSVSYKPLCYVWLRDKNMQNHNVGNTNSSPLLNLLIRQVYGHDLQSMFFIYTIAKMDTKNIL